MSDKREPRELLPAYAADLLDPADRRTVELEVDLASPEVEAELRAWSDTFERLAVEGSDPVEPSRHVRQRVLAAARGSRPAQEAREELGGAASESVGGADAPAPGGSRLRWALAASLLGAGLALVALWQVARQQGDLRSLEAERAGLAARVEAVAEELLRTRGDVGRLAAAVNTLAYPQRNTVLLAGLEQAPGALGATFVRAETATATFQAYGLPALEAGRVYQLWYIIDSGPVSGGIFEVDARGDATVNVADVAPNDEIQAWAVTVEPAGGVVEPTGTMVLLSA